MEKFEDRLETFSNWFYTRARPNTIAEAGFFAIGKFFLSQIKLLRVNSLQSFAFNTR